MEKDLKKKVVDTRKEIEKEKENIAARKPEAQKPKQINFSLVNHITKDSVKSINTIDQSYVNNLDNDFKKSLANKSTLKISYTMNNQFSVSETIPYEIIKDCILIVRTEI